MATVVTEDDVRLLVRKTGGKWVAVRDSEVGSLTPADWQEALVLPGKNDLAFVMANMIQDRAEVAVPLSEIKDVVRSCPFIFDGSVFHLPRPTSVGAGMARHQWFKRSGYAGTVIIASPDKWKELERKHPVSVLYEYRDGTYGVGDG